MATTTITLSEPWIGSYDETPRRGLGQLGSPFEHVHGAFDIRVSGKLLPRLGIFGSDDVCMNEWARELLLLSAAMNEEGARHTYDEGEQGQPAYAFSRSGLEIEVQVVAGVGGGDAHPEWQGIRCDAAQFLQEVRSFLAGLEELLVAQAGTHGQEWINQVRKEAGQHLA